MIPHEKIKTCAKFIYFKININIVNIAKVCTYILIQYIDRRAHEALEFLIETYVLSLIWDSCMK